MYMDICKRETKNSYNCYIFNQDEKIVWKKAYDLDDNLYWQVVNYGDDIKNIIRLDIDKNDENFELVDELFNEISNSSKENKESYYIDDIHEYDNFGLYNKRENYIHWISDTGRINSEELYILKNDETYGIVFISHASKLKNIKITFSTCNSKYGNFSEAFRRDFGRTLDIAYDRYDECFNKIVNKNKQYKKVG